MDIERLREAAEKARAFIGEAEPVITDITKGKTEDEVADMIAQSVLEVTIPLFEKTMGVSSIKVMEALMRRMGLSAN